MASRLTPLGIFSKWVVIPLGVAAIGYFLVGPNLGDEVLKNVEVPKTLSSILPGNSASEISEKPSLEIQVRPASQD